MSLPQQTGLAQSANRVSYSEPFSTRQGNQATLADRKKYIQYNSAFSGTSTLVLCSSSRVGGTINNALYRLNKPIIAYAASLKSLTIPVSWPNVSQTISFNVTYNPGGQPYVGNFVLGPGNYTYNLYQGQVTYAYVNAQSIYVNANDLVWYILRWFGGAVTSITINPITGGWTWNWNSAMTSVTSTDPAVATFFQISQQTGVTWIGTNPVDLSGPKDLLINCPELASEAYFSASAANQSYICSAPVNSTYGDVLMHEPTQEVVNYFANEKPISQITVSIVDAQTGNLVELYLDYILELRFYLTQPINQ